MDSSGENAVRKSQDLPRIMRCHCSNQDAALRFPAARPNALLNRACRYRTLDAIDGRSVRTRYTMSTQIEALSFCRAICGSVVEPGRRRL
jgi:hypothetical protein